MITAWLLEMPPTQCRDFGDKHEAISFAAERPATPMTTRQRRVLIAEDDTLIRAMIVDVLIDHDFDVLEASNGAQAIHLMDDPDYIQLVVTDPNMPEVDGIVVARHARAHHPDVPVLFISGRPDLLVAGQPPEPFRYLAKPFRLGSFIAAVDGLVGER